MAETCQTRYQNRKIARVRHRPRLVGEQECTKTNTSRQNCSSWLDSLWLLLWLPLPCPEKSNALPSKTFSPPIAQLMTSSLQSRDELEKTSAKTGSPRHCPRQVVLGEQERRSVTTPTKRCPDEQHRNVGHPLLVQCHGKARLLLQPQAATAICIMEC